MSKKPTKNQKSDRNRSQNHLLETDTKYLTHAPKVEESQVSKTYCTILEMSSKKKGKIFPKKVLNFSLVKRYP